MSVRRTPLDDADPYVIIGVPQTATRREINARYRERMRGVAMQDKLYQQIQVAKESLTKQGRRLRADLMHVPSTGLLAELMTKARGQRLELALVNIEEVAAALCEAADPVPGPDLSSLVDSGPGDGASSETDPIALQLDQVGP